MNYIDIVILVIWVIAIINGIWEGLIKQVFGIIALILACYCSWKFSGFAADKLAQWFQWDGQGATITSYIITFVVVLFGVALIGRILDKGAKITMLGWLNRGLGAIFGWFKWNLLLIALMYVLTLFDNAFHFLPEAQIAASKCWPIIEKIASLLTPYLPTWGA